MASAPAAPTQPRPSRRSPAGKNATSPALGLSAAASDSCREPQPRRSTNHGSSPGAERVRTHAALTPTPCSPYPAVRPSSRGAPAERDAPRARDRRFGRCPPFAALIVGVILAFTVLLAPTVAAGQATTLVSTRGVSGTERTTHVRMAQSFTTGSELNGYTLTSVKVATRLGSATLRLYADSSGLPPAAAFTDTSPLATFTGGSGSTVKTYTLASGQTLAPGTKYWLVLSPAGGVLGGGYHVRTSTSTATTGLSGWSVGTMVVDDDGTGEQWVANHGFGTLRVELLGSVNKLPVPPGFTARTDSRGALLAWRKPAPLGQ